MKAHKNLYLGIRNTLNWYKLSEVIPRRGIIGY